MIETVDDLEHYSCAALQDDGALRADFESLIRLVDGEEFPADALAHAKRAMRCMVRAAVERKTFPIKVSRMDERSAELFRDVAQLERVPVDMLEAKGRDRHRGFLETGHVVQRLILDKQRFQRLHDAKSWSAQAGFEESGETLETFQDYRIDQFEAERCASGSVRTVEISAGVFAVCCQIGADAPALESNDPPAFPFPELVEGAAGVGVVVTVERDLTARQHDSTRGFGWAPVRVNGERMRGLRHFAPGPWGALNEGAGLFPEQLVGPLSQLYEAAKGQREARELYHVLRPVAIETWLVCFEGRSIEQPGALLAAFRLPYTPGDQFAEHPFRAITSDPHMVEFLEAWPREALGAGRARLEDLSRLTADPRLSGLTLEAEADRRVRVVPRDRFRFRVGSSSAWERVFALESAAHMLGTWALRGVRRRGAPGAWFLQRSPSAA